ncbi:MAG: hypothetical protein EBS38_07030 [Actinobacteria bacterium]|nr:hypothetical protein [Actinomycetota bacterium]
MITADGVWEVTPAGLVSFTPAKGFVGLAEQRYSVRDLEGQQAISTIAVNVLRIQLPVNPGGSVEEQPEPNSTSSQSVDVEILDGPDQLAQTGASNVLILATTALSLVVGGLWMILASTRKKAF